MRDELAERREGLLERARANVSIALSLLTCLDGLPSTKATELSAKEASEMA